MVLCIPRVSENMCFPPISVRVIVLIAIIFALITIVLAVVVLTRSGLGVAAALGAVATTAMLSEGVMHRLIRWQRPSSA